VSAIRRLVWLCRDAYPYAGRLSKRRFEHKLFSGKPARVPCLSGAGTFFAATDRVAFLGAIVLPMRGVRALQPGEGRWVRLTLEVPSK
jgi:hypothetical protein